MVDQGTNSGGTATILSGQNCTWDAPKSGTAIVTISNLSREYYATVVVSGAPDTGISVNINGNTSSSPFHGIFKLDPDVEKVFVIVASGNFEGHTLTITNMTPLEQDAAVYITTS